MTTKSVLDRTTTTTPELDKISSDIGLLVLRAVFGLLLAAHGTQKLFGWFWGIGWTANASAFDSMGYSPGKFFGTIAGLSELTGGLLLALGLVTPLAAAIVLGTMLCAINTTWGPGLFGDMGWERAFLFAVVAVAVAFTGPGKFSLDYGRPWQRGGFALAAAAIALAVVGAVLTWILKSML